MSSRNKIVDTLVTLLKTIDGTNGFNTNLYNNVQNGLLFLDEVNDYPYVSLVAGPETRQYLPADFTWGFLNVPIKIYVNSGDSKTDLEGIIEDIEKIVNENSQFSYSTGRSIQDMKVLEIDTDQGLLAPLGVGEIVLQIQYDV